MDNINASKDIERLLQFALKHKMIEELDVIPSRNALLDLFQINEPYTGVVEEEHKENAVGILDNLLDYAYDIAMIKENTVSYRDLLDAKIMGLLMPRQSEVVKKFFHDVNTYGPQKATDDFYALSKASNYIRMDRIEKNLYWLAPTSYGDLEITINLSKPEKDPKEIAASRLRPQSNYPKCLLCIENVGYPGHINHPARQNHRVIPVKVGGEQWYLQYSPYVYYNEHCILFHESHVPMKISQKTFERLFDFVEQFPHYFIGSNADLPIVGGSILSHEHFQGGRHVFPMETAAAEREFSNAEFSDIKCSIVKWPMSVIRLSGPYKEELTRLSMDILERWRAYSDQSQNILAYSIKQGESVPHNTITPIVRKNKQGMFEIDLVLRNNRTDEEHPDGIFHPHRELHHIKKENIGLIEVMGLAVLPARLSIELKEIEMVLTGSKGIKEFEDENNPIYKHLPWIKELAARYGTALSTEKAEAVLKEEVGIKFQQVLMDAGVYKKDDKGMAGFTEFMLSAGFKVIE
jgi:UDPglucose--hexose-1-phosphate uridylyltransferase